MKLDVVMVGKKGLQPSGFVVTNFEENFCLHLQCVFCGAYVPNFLTRNAETPVSLKDWYMSTKIHGVIFQKAVIRILTFPNLEPWLSIFNTDTWFKLQYSVSFSSCHRAR